MKTSEGKRFQTFLSILFLTLIVFSTLFSFAESEHKINCHEDNCPVCLVLEVVKSNLEVLILTSVIFEINHFFSKTEKTKFPKSNKSEKSNTLFSLKIRLND